MIRAARHSNLTELAEAATVPVINGLTNLTHPCQVMADVMTLEEHVAPVKDLTVSWVGDGNNVAASWIHAVGRMGGKLRIGTPKELEPSPEVMAWASAEGADVRSCTRPRRRWRERIASSPMLGFRCMIPMPPAGTICCKPYQVNRRLMEAAARCQVHALPARPSRRGGDGRGDGRPQLADLR